MILYSIPDIRLFWTNDEKFLSQFVGKSCMDNITFTEYAKIPSITKDISFWLPACDVEIVDENNKIIWTFQNDFMDIVRNCMDTNIEKIELVDQFFHPKKTTILTMLENDIKSKYQYNRSCYILFIM